MRIRLGVLVGCMLLVHGSRAEDGKTALPPDDSTSPRAVNDPQPVDPGTPNDRPKNRYISFKPNNIVGQTVMLEVTLTASLPHPGLVGSSWWVQAPLAPGNPLLPPGECVALLGSQATAADIDWADSGCTVLHVTGCPIEPTSDYDVRVVAGADVSNPLAVPTILQPSPKFWGDIVGSFNGVEWAPPNGSTSIDDIVAAIKTWQSGPVVAPVFAVAHLSVADVAPGNINLVVNFNDVFQVVQAFIGGQYPFGPADPDGGCTDDPGVNGQGTEIRFVPIRSAPLGSPVGTLGDPVNATFNGTLGCWQVLVEPGVEVNLDLQALGWGNAVGSPTLGAIQANVVSTGYDNDAGGPVGDLRPKGWPTTPGDGAYQASNACGGGGNGSPCVLPFDPTCDGGANGDCLPSPDWVMPDCATNLAAIATPTLDYGWATTGINDCVIDDGLVKTMGGLILEVPVDASGTYLIDLDPAPNSSFMTTGAGTPITGITFTPACITVALGPPILAPPPHDILKNRYISINPRGAGGNNPPFMDIKLTLTSTLVNGVPTGQIGAEWWANEPDANCISIVGPTRPLTPPNWSGCPTLHLTGCPIIPTSDYDIVAVDGTAVSNPPLSAHTQAKPGNRWWGDTVGSFDGTRWTPPNGIVNIGDAVAAIKTFQNPNAINATHVSVADLAPNEPIRPPPGNQIDKFVNIIDVLWVLIAFQGEEYPGPQIDLCPDPS